MEQIAEDDVSNLTESRKVGIAGFGFVLLFTLLNDGIVSLISDITQLLQNLGGSESTLFP